MQEKHWTLPERSVPVLATVDVIVVGGGFPGVCAAVAAARTGAEVALIERDGLLGGQAAEIPTFGICAFIDDNGKQFIKGIPWEIVQETIAEGQSDALWEMVDYQRLGREGMEAELQRFGLPLIPGKNDVFLHPNAFRHVIQVLVDQEGVTTLLEAPLSDVLLDGNHVRGVVAMGCYDPFALETKVVVDTTPHAAVAALAGRPFAYPEVYTGTSPRVGGIDIHRVIGYMRDNPDDVRVSGWEKNDPDLFKAMVDRGLPLIMRGFTQARQKAIADDPAYEITGRGEDRSFTFHYVRDGTGAYWIHSPEWRISRLDDVLHLCRMMVEMRKRQWLTHKMFRNYVPGFDKAHLMDVQPHVARALLRSREPGGFVEYDVPWEHIEKDGNLYEDSIARVMGHHDQGQALGGWQLPYRSLIPKGLEGVLVTGKPACRFLHIHATHAAVGQAAGVAAAIAARDEVPLRELDVPKVQKELERQGAVVF